MGKLVRINTSELAALRKLRSLIKAPTDSAVIGAALMAYATSLRDQARRLPSDVYDVVPRDALDCMIEVFREGASREGRYPLAWRDDPETNRTKVRGAARRHREAHDRGEHFDEDSGLPHLAHAAANQLIELDLMECQEADPAPQD